MRDDGGSLPEDEAPMGRVQRESRLPRWAQSELKRLRSNLAGAKQELEEMRGERGTTVFLIDADSESPLPDDSMVRFRLQPEGSPKWEQYFDCRLNGQGRLEVRSASSINIQPRASNSFLVQIEERF